MKKLLFITMILAFTDVKAQEKLDDSYLGLKLGWNYSTNTFTNPSLDNMDVNFKSGFAGGLFCNIPISEKFSIQPEILYSQTGSEIVETEAEGSPTTTLSLDYFSIPVLIKFRVLDKLSLFLGPQFDIKFDANADYSTSGDEDLQAQIEPYDFAMTAGLEYWFTNFIGIYGRYSLGFQDANTKNPGIDLATQTVNSEVTNHGFQVGIAFALRTKSGSEGVTTMTSDSDGDGITDGFDKCPSVAGTAKYNGCPPPDQDNDGVNDEIDKCPTVAGTATYNGCPPPDQDNDGVNDEIDKCPTVAGTAKYNGCPIPDTDGDGINNESDKCPNTAGIEGNMGCPEMILYYQREEADLDANDMSNLDIVVSFMNRHPDLSIIIEGHTSTPGDDAYNLKLSEKRANDAVNYMVSKGVDRNRMSAKGLGEQFPIGDNTTDDSRGKSRRVVIKIAQ